MYTYFIYSADFYDRSVGTVLFNEKLFTKEQFKEIVKVAKSQTDGLESSIIEYLVKYCKFYKPDIPKCNIENI
ncbi:hypothetical protein AB1L07_02140 [Niallia alba]|uniref:hypothetical protein n=1 Tax=Niallia alba TaxID=2729105 RepID=UPI0039A0C8C0